MRTHAYLPHFSKRLRRTWSLYACGHTCFGCHAALVATLFFCIPFHNTEREQELHQYKCPWGEVRSQMPLRLGYIAVSAKRGQLSWNLEVLQPAPNLKWRKHKKKLSVWKQEVWVEVRPQMPLRWGEVANAPEVRLCMPSSQGKGLTPEGMYKTGRILHTGPESQRLLRHSLFSIGL